MKWTVFEGPQAQDEVDVSQKRCDYTATAPFGDRLPQKLVSPARRWRELARSGLKSLGDPVFTINLHHKFISNNNSLVTLNYDQRLL